MQSSIADYHGVLGGCGGTCHLETVIHAQLPSDSSGRACWLCLEEALQMVPPCLYRLCLLLQLVSNRQKSFKAVASHQCM